MIRRSLAALMPAVLIACGSATPPASAADDRPFEVTPVGTFNDPWAMVFVPSTPFALITEKGGKLKLWQASGPVRDVAGVPEVAVGGQGGLGDVVLGPNYKTDRMIYLSWVEHGEANTRGAVVSMARLNIADPAKPSISGLKIIWKQTPKVEGEGHFSHRIVFSPDGKYMFLSSGERQKFTPAQDLKQNLGKVLRLYPDGSVPADNPYVGQGSPTDQIWSLGHRNLLGLTFDDHGNLWEQEMGPKGGDEVNLISRKGNYGWPIASNGSNYDGTDIPDHKPGDGFEPPKVFWNPSISPAGLAFYNADLFPEWQQSLFLGGLSGQALIRIKLADQTATKADQWDMGTRIREVEVGPEGGLWLLEDGEKGSGGRLLKLTPKKSAD